MENQRLPPGEGIIFDPRTVLALRVRAHSASRAAKAPDAWRCSLYIAHPAPRNLSCQKTLRVLNLAGNRLESLDDLGALQTIEELDVSNNNISNLAVRSVFTYRAAPCPCVDCSSLLPFVFASSTRLYGCHLFASFCGPTESSAVHAEQHRPSEAQRGGQPILHAVQISRGGGFCSDLDVRGSSRVCRAL